MRQSVENFFNWLSDEFVGRAMLGYVIFTALIIVSLDYTVKSLLINWHIIPFPPLPTSTDTPFKYYGILNFLSMFIF